MRKLLLSGLLSIIIFSASAQIEPFYGIYFIEGCQFETPCELVNPELQPGSLWQRGAPDKLTFNESYSFPNAMVTDTVNPYPAGANAWFDLKFDLIEYFYGQNILIDFRHKFNTDTLLDGGYIETSYDGLTWYNIIQDPTVMVYNSENMYNVTDTLKGGIPGFSGSSGDWIYTRIQLIYWFPVKWPNETLSVRFHFISDDIETAKDGWMIDNLDASVVDMGGAVSKNNLINASVFPNPVTSNSKLTFDNPSGETVKIEIIDQIGKVARLLETRDSNIILEKGNLQQGIYLLKLTKQQQLAGVVKLLVE